MLFITLVCFTYAPQSYGALPVSQEQIKTEQQAASQASASTSSAAAPSTFAKATQASLSSFAPAFAEATAGSRKATADRSAMPGTAADKSPSATPNAAGSAMSVGTVPASAASSSSSSSSSSRVKRISSSLDTVHRIRARNIAEATKLPNDLVTLVQGYFFKQELLDTINRDLAHYNAILFADGTLEQWRSAGRHACHAIPLVMASNPRNTHFAIGYADGNVDFYRPASTQHPHGSKQTLSVLTPATDGKNITSMVLAINATGDRMVCGVNYDEEPEVSAAEIITYAPGQSVFYLPNSYMSSLFSDPSFMYSIDSVAISDDSAEIFISVSGREEYNSTPDDRKIIGLKKGSDKKWALAYQFDDITNGVGGIIQSSPNKLLIANGRDLIIHKYIDNSWVAVGTIKPKPRYIQNFTQSGDKKHLYTLEKEALGEDVDKYLTSIGVYHFDEDTENWQDPTHLSMDTYPIVGLAGEIIAQPSLIVTNETGSIIAVAPHGEKRIRVFRRLPDNRWARISLPTDANISSLYMHPQDNSITVGTTAKQFEVWNLYDNRKNPISSGVLEQFIDTVNTQGISSDTYRKKIEELFAGLSKVTPSTPTASSGSATPSAAAPTELMPVRRSHSAKEERDKSPSAASSSATTTGSATSSAAPSFVVLTKKESAASARDTKSSILKLEEPD